MSLITTSRIVSRAASLPPELLVACLHTSSPYAASSSTPSRIRLVKDIKSSPQGKVEVAPKFSREDAPHIGRKSHDPSVSAPIRRLGTREQDLRRHGRLPPSLTLSSPRRQDDRRPPKREDERTQKPKVVNLLSDELDISKRSVSTQGLRQEFAAPPLMPGLVDPIHNVLGPDAQPTPIQGLSLKYLFKETREPEEYYEHLLASETGSGKSMAYLLPLIQDLKTSELNGTRRRGQGERRAANPRALVLAPTHELSRQLSGFAKELIHGVKLRVMCASQANIASRRGVTAAKLAESLVERDGGELVPSGEIVISREGSMPDVDIMVGTPSKILELMRGRGWDHEEEDRDEELWSTSKRSRQRKTTTGKPQMNLADVEWVVVDEADVLFDPDFQEATRSILADIAAARGTTVPFDANLDLATKGQPTPVKYPFNLILTSATIPSYLAAYLDKFHPTLTRLVSPHLHRLPSTLKTEHFNWTGGNRDADIEHRLRQVWFDDVRKGTPKSKVLVFCNKSARVENLGTFLRERGIANVALTSAGDTRKRGSNHHLDGFLRVRDVPGPGPTAAASPSVAPSGAEAMDDLKEVPHVMITTSLLSRGLDFAADVKHVFIVDEPRNMVDFLHRAGRSGRAGEAGKVVVFGKAKGRGSEKAKVVRKKVNALGA